MPKKRKRKGGNMRDSAALYNINQRTQRMQLRTKWLKE
jgi:hypothetical protein